MISSISRYYCHSKMTDICPILSTSCECVCVFIYAVEAFDFVSHKRPCTTHTDGGNQDDQQSHRYVYKSELIELDE